jgi:putative transposase
MGIYGSPRIVCDLREAGLACGENRVAWLMKVAHIQSVRGYKRPRFKAGVPALVATNQSTTQCCDDRLYTPNLAATSSPGGAKTTA